MHFTDATGTKACHPSHTLHRAIAQTILMLTALCTKIETWYIIESLIQLRAQRRAKSEHSGQGKRRWWWAARGYDRTCARLAHGCDRLYKMSVGPGLSAPHYGVGRGSMRVYVQRMGDAGGDMFASAVTPGKTDRQTSTHVPGNYPKETHWVTKRKREERKWGPDQDRVRNSE